jgi:hypothetical protein
MCMEKQERKEEKNICEWKKKKKRGGSNKDMRGMNEVKEKKNKV